MPIAGHMRCTLLNLLSKARLLREFYVYRDDDDPNSKPSEEAVIELTKYRRVSPKAKVFFRNMDVSPLLVNFLVVMAHFKLNFALPHFIT